MPSKKPHVLIDAKYHKVLRKAQRKTKLDIPVLLGKIFDSSEYYQKIKNEIL